VQTAIFSKAADGLLALYESVKNEPLVAVKFREWNALLAKVYGSPLGKPALFVNHTYLTLISRIIVTLALKGSEPKKSDWRGLLDGSFFARQLKLKNLAELISFRGRSTPRRGRFSCAAWKSFPALRCL